MRYVEAFTAEDIAHLLDINVLGAQRVNRAVLPHLRERRKETLLCVGSTSVIDAPPFLTLPEREPRRRPGTLPGLRGSRPPRSPNTEATNSLFEPGIAPGPATVAKEITRILTLPHGARPFRSVVDFTRFVIGEIIDATESHIREAMTHLGLTNLLTVNQSRENA
ncbi:hypothetical protein GA0115239_109410 [Streptomyces sp. BpilaLS-43]|uniref:hypothetical protein n=1 Tax=Streptomyces sp. BpilaLS-43 TaxID=1839778 RepID=UPI00081AEDB1|nr:hypothetical protein [Streptomyces sp. BpilaLS-43]SCD83291.1 hypothetical protein GA0115239_109410 [Streptomyces sp. BpilaLS-43]